jgi:hypothetical protein
VLAGIYRIAYRQNASVAEQEICLGNDAEYPLCLGYAAFAVRELLLSVEPSLMLGKSNSVGIAVGFDSGDFILLGELTKNGLIPLDPKSKPTDVRIESLLNDLGSSDNKIAILAVFGLKRFGELARKAIPQLLRVVSASQDIELRQAVVNTLAAIASDDAQAKSVVLQALEDSSPFVRREALQALISFRELSQHDLTRIKEMGNDSDKDVVTWSKIALGNIKRREQEPRERS